MRNGRTAAFSDFFQPSSWVAAEFALTLIAIASDYLFWPYRALCDHALRQRFRPSDPWRLSGPQTGTLRIWDHVPKFVIHCYCTCQNISYDSLLYYMYLSGAV
jgi:hypothetical protein